MAGNETFFMTWLNIMLFLLSPRALANKIYSLFNTSITFSLVCKHIFETPIRLNVIAGKIIWLTKSAKVTLDDSTPIGTPKATGNIPSFTENTTINNIPNQNVGVEITI